MFRVYYPALDHRRRSPRTIIPFLELASSESRATRCSRVRARSSALENSLRKNGAFRLVVNGADVRSGTSRFELSSFFFFFTQIRILRSNPLRPSRSSFVRRVTFRKTTVNFKVRFSISRNFIQLEIISMRERERDKLKELKYK